MAGNISDIPNGLPSHDTIARVFARLNTQAFEQCFHQWVESISEAISAQVIPIDGKTVRQSFEESDFFRGRWDWQCGKMTQCQILSNNLSSTS
ncbi:putative H repeat-associated protein [Tolypothrix sp. NIES-4075]|nr:transposase family protein [Tolypothrix sp. NIES-4075]GAX45622.1 putative H repeat-associated protein [Tolypothrix sp. NIES-4075]